MTNRPTIRWTRENLAWLAGFLEGEGCFLLTTKRSPNGIEYFVFAVNTVTTDGDVLQRAAVIAGFGACLGPYLQKNPKHKPFWRWHVRRRDEVYALCAAIYPWMGERRQSKIREIFLAYRTSFMPPWRHGTRHSYERIACRCSACRAANAARHRERRSQRNS